VLFLKSTGFKVRYRRRAPEFVSASRWKNTVKEF
jgi:hypothetical protein